MIERRGDGEKLRLVRSFDQSLFLSISGAGSPPGWFLAIETALTVLFRLRAITAGLSFIGDTSYPLFG